MENRLPPDDETKKARIQEEITRRVNAIRDHACMLHDLMEFGMTVIVELEEVSHIIAPGQAPKTRRLLITKPIMMLEVK